MTTESITDIDKQIAELKAKKKALHKKTTRTPRIVRERIGKKVVCTHCGMLDFKTSMQRISRYEYQHVMCEPHVPRTIRVDFQL